MKDKLFYLAVIATVIGVLVITISKIPDSFNTTVATAVTCAFYLAAAGLLTIRRHYRKL